MPSLFDIAESPGKNSSTISCENRNHRISSLKKLPLCSEQLPPPIRVYKQKTCAKGCHTSRNLRTRRAGILPMRRIREVHFNYKLHQVCCHHCHECFIEQIPFISHPKDRLSNEFERTLLELREQISIRALANYFHLRRYTLKEIEKRYLQNRFGTNDTPKVQAAGVDEIQHRAWASEQGLSHDSTGFGERSCHSCRQRHRRFHLGGSPVLYFVLLRANTIKRCTTKLMKNKTTSVSILDNKGFIPQYFLSKEMPT